MGFRNLVWGPVPQGSGRLKGWIAAGTGQAVDGGNLAPSRDPRP